MSEATERLKALALKLNPPAPAPTEQPEACTLCGEWLAPSIRVEAAGRCRRCRVAQAIRDTPPEQRDPRAPYMIWSEGDEDMATKWGPCATLHEATVMLAEVHLHRAKNRATDPHVRDCYRNRLDPLREGQVPCICRHRGPTHGPDGCRSCDCPARSVA